jgi:hypothetical protein
LDLHYFTYFSVSLDEITDITPSTLISITVQFVKKKNNQVQEELLKVATLSRILSWVNIYILKNFAVALLTFSSIYTYENLLSYTNYMKSNFRNRHTNKINDSCVNLRRTNYKSDITTLAAKIHRKLF